MKVRRVIIVGVILTSMTIFGACRGNTNNISPFIDGENTSNIVTESGIEEGSLQENIQLDGEEVITESTTLSLEELAIDVEDIFDDLSNSTENVDATEITDSVENIETNNSKHNNEKTPVTDTSESDEARGNNTLGELDDVL